MTYFTINELTQSDTAKKKKIDNTPDEKIVEHLTELIGVLNGIRESLGKPINVSSGYRCKALNTAVGGSATSSHLYGYAVDIWVKDMSYTELCKFIRDYLEKNNISWDQIIEEKSGKSTWCHFGLKNSKGQQRKQYFNMTK